MQLIPNAKAQFIDSGGQPLSSGTVGFYFPGTLNPKPTYQDQAGTIANTNPVQLDSRGQALIWGSGVYRQIVKDASGVTIWDQITEDSNAGLTGNMTNARWVAGASYTDPVGSVPGTFVPGTTTTFNLPVAPGAIANIYPYFDLGFQQDDQISSLTGTTLVFTSPVPLGTSAVEIKIGSTIALGVVNDVNVASGSKLYNRITDFNDVRDFGAIGNGTTDDSTAFTNVPSPLFVTPCASSYLINANTTVTADLIFVGGVITVPAGVTLTLNGEITAASRVIFKGDGTVVINKGEIDVSWFDGTDASTKWAFCARGIQNTNGLGKIVVFPKPAATDPWATVFQIGGNDVWGPRWRVDAPIIINSPQQATEFRTPGGFVATTAMPWMWQLGTPTDPLKVDYCHFPEKLSIEGNNGLCQFAGIMYGSSHMRIPYQEIYRTAGWLVQPTQNKQVSDIKFDFIDSGGLYGPLLTLDGSNGANNTITDFVVDFINSTGFTSGHAPNALVQMNSNYHGIKIGKVVHRAVVAGTQDATGGVVSLFNVGATAGNFFSTFYGVEIGSIVNGSLAITARAIQIADGSGGIAAKHTGVVIGAGSFVNGPVPGGFDITLDYCDGAIVQGLRSQRSISVSASCVGTQIYGVPSANVADGGVGTLINGKSKLGTSPVSMSASGATQYVNNNAYDVDYQIQGGTITTVNITRGATVLSAYSGASLGAGLFRLSPGDSVAVAYSGSPTANIIPR
jgi:hypothetical protein